MFGWGDDLVDSAFGSGSSGPGSSLGRGHLVVFLSKTLHFLSDSLKQGVQLGVTLRWTSIIHPGGSRNTPSRFMLHRPGSVLKLRPGGPLVRVQTLPTVVCLPWF